MVIEFVFFYTPIISDVYSSEVSCALKNETKKLAEHGFLL